MCAWELILSSPGSISSSYLTGVSTFESRVLRNARAALALSLLSGALMSAVDDEQVALAHRTPFHHVRWPLVPCVAHWAGTHLA